MSKIYWRGILFLFVSQYLWTMYPEYKLFYTPCWQQGGIANAFVYPITGINDINFYLEKNNYELNNNLVKIKGKGFVYSPQKIKNKDIFLMLIGISALIPSDDYVLRVVLDLNNGNKHEIITDIIGIKKGGYTKEVIKMNSKAQKTINNRSPDRQYQSKTFYKVLNLFDKKAIYDSKRWSMPVIEKFYYTSRYGALREFIYPDGSKGKDFHNGEDFAGLPVGTTVNAVADGMVVLSENRIVTGNTVIVSHLPGFFSLYYHMSDLRAEVNDFVKRGDPVGGIGATGFATGPHLHLTAYTQGQEVDPQWLFTRDLVDEYWLAYTLQGLKVSL